VGKRRRKQEVGGGNDTAEAAVFADLERKLWESILGLQERVGRERASDFVAFDVSYAVQEVSKTASMGAKNGILCPGNERCAVESEYLWDGRQKPLPTGSLFVDAITQISLAVVLAALTSCMRSASPQAWSCNVTVYPTHLLSSCPCERKAISNRKI
jgi:hypothetical protein